MQAVESSESITFRVTFRGETETFRLPPNAHLDELSNLLYSSFGTVPNTQKLLPRKLVKEKQNVPRHSTGSSSAQPETEAVFKGKAGGLLKLTEEGLASLSITQVGICEGSSFNLLASTDDDLNYVASLQDDPLLRGIEEEEELERRRRDRSSGPHKAPTAPLNGHGFGDFRTLKPSDLGDPSLLPPPEEALRIMHSLATDVGIMTVMKKYKWRVGIMTEMPPVGKVGISPRCVLGFNVNRGQEISLRLRTDDLKGFRKYEVIRATLLHELAHMVFDEHDDNFKALNSKLVKEAQVSAHRIGGAHVPNISSASSASSQLQVQTLGGSKALVADPRTAAALAALSRHTRESVEEAEVQPMETETAGRGMGNSAGEQGRGGGESNAEASTEHETPSKKQDEFWEEERSTLASGANRMTGLDTTAQGRDTELSLLGASLDPDHTSDEQPLQVGSETESVEASPDNPVKEEGPSAHQSAGASSSLLASEVEDIELPDEVSAAASGSKDAQCRLKSVLTCLEEEVRASGSEVASKALITLRTVLRNVLEHPTDLRYRTIKKSNKKVQDTLSQFPSMLELLRIAGFKDGEAEVGGVLHCRTPDPGLLWLACAMLEESGLISGSAWL